MAAYYGASPNGGYHAPPGAPPAMMPAYHAQAAHQPGHYWQQPGPMLAMGPPPGQWASPAGSPVNAPGAPATANEVLLGHFFREVVPQINTIEETSALLNRELERTETQSTLCTKAVNWNSATILGMLRVIGTAVDGTILAVNLRFRAILQDSYVQVLLVRSFTAYVPMRMDGQRRHRCLIDPGPCGGRRRADGTTMMMMVAVWPRRWTRCGRAGPAVSARSKSLATTPA
jgi:hypothetical protein